MANKKKIKNKKIIFAWLQKAEDDLSFDLKNFRKDLRILTEAYIPSRYPSNGYTKASKEDAKQCLKSAEKIIDLIKTKMDFSIYYN